MPKPLRRLFLDDDPRRAEVFLERFPDAVWVETVPECVTKLAERWDEIHLDHDLGGEVYVDSERDDCGMEVVRWIVAKPREHLRSARFILHSHNPSAAFIMAFQLQATGFQVETRPFGTEPPVVPPRSQSAWQRARSLLRRCRGLPPDNEPPVADLDPDSPDWIP